MEISAATSSAYLPPQLSEPRAARNVPREGLGAQERPANKDRIDLTTQQSTVASRSDPLNIRQSQKANEPQAAADARSERQSSANDRLDEAKAVEKQPVTLATGGSVKMDVEDGDRVLRVFDSKDVLIYQLPPKGALMLIKAQENADQSQVQTSA